MPVTTASADQIVFVNGRPTLAAQPNHTNSIRSQYSSSYKGRKHGNKKNKCRAEQITPLLDLVTPGSPVALDCEGVLLPDRIGWRKHGVGRISLINIEGKVVYDTFVYYPSNVNHRPSPQRLKLGVKYDDILESNGAQAHAEVLAVAKAIFDKSGIVVAHAATNDEQMLLGIDFNKYVVYDTQQYLEYQRETEDGYENRALSGLAVKVLQRSIQVKEHSSVEDARATMDLFLLHHSTYEAGYDYAGKPLSSTTLINNASTSTHNTASSSGTQASIPGASTLKTVSTLASSASHLTTASRVALPDIKSMANGRKFDYKTSRYY